MKWPALLVGLAALGLVVGVGGVKAHSTLGTPTVGTIAVTHNTLTVPWTAPSDNGGAAISAYGATTDHGGTRSSATAPTLGGSAGGLLEPKTGEDVFSIVLNADAELWIHTSGALEAVGELLHSSNTVLKEADSTTLMDAPGGFEFREKLDARTHHIRSAPSGNATGDYPVGPLQSTYNRTAELCTGITTPQSDPWYGCQWHLSNTGQFTGGAGQDINVESVWAGGNKGAGVNVAVVDDGIQSDHPDLSANVVTALSYRYPGSGSDLNPFDFHGTAVAGIIAAAANDIGVRGVAPEASIYSYNLAAVGVSTLNNEADAMARNLEDTGVSNNSWGFADNARPHTASALWEAAVARGVTEGYGGKGTVYVWAGGNGAQDDDDSNLDGRANYYAVMAACAVGYDDIRAWYSEPGANLWVCAPSDSTAGLPGIATTYPGSRYFDDFSGTSAAVPIVSGVVALVRAANANLSWRDVKLILAASARQNDSSDRGWATGALKYGSTTERYSFNHEYGFGVVDAQAAVTLAEGWAADLPALRTLEVDSGSLNLALPDRGTAFVPPSIVTTLDLDSYVGFLEFVEIEVDIEHDSFRNLLIELISPAGESSTLSTSSFQLSFYESVQLDGAHRFGSARHVGEDAQGTWQLRFTDMERPTGGTLRSWKLKAYGHGYVPGYAQIDEVTSGSGSFTVTWTAPTDSGREGSPITSYDLRYIRDAADDVAAANWTEVIGIDSLTHTVSRLEGEVTYRVRVRAVNSDGNGPWSDIVTGVTQPGKPEAPRSVVVTPRAEALAVSWRLPAYVGDEDPTAYDVRYIRSDADDKADNLWHTVPNAWTTADGELRSVIRSLDNGVQYDIQLLARNSAGESGWSAVAMGTPTDMNGPAEFPNTETGRRSVPENTVADVDIGEPVAARDDEGDTPTYSLTGGAANFDIDPATGQLRTKAALDREQTSSYSVSVAVHDGKAGDSTASTAIDDTIGVTIEVEDVDEPPLVTGNVALTVRENITAVATYSASDPERVTSTFTWTLGGDDASAFAISDRGVLTFDPAPNFEAPTDSAPVNVYQVTVRVTDESAVDDSARTGELAVEVTVEGVDEPPEFRGDATYTIAENGAKRVGSYTATDPEGGVTTWLGLTGTDARHFAFDSDTGELSFVETPDFDPETNGNHGPTYRVIVRASDERNRIGMFPVTVTLTPVDEGPLIEGDAVVDLDEVIDPTPGQVVRVDTYTKRDPERSATNWGGVGGTTVLGGSDAGAFDFNQSTGALTFKRAPDYENGGGEYQLTLTANDGMFNGHLDVTVNVANLDDRGTLTLGAQRGVINVALSATLTDPDNVVGSATWTWQRSTSRTGGWTDIAGAHSSSYTPTGDDRNHYLRVSATYEDGHGTGKSAHAVTELTTVNERGSNTAPVLPDAIDDITIPEDTPAQRNVGSPVQATDTDNDPLVYSLSGPGEFAIGRTTGQLQVANEVTFDYDQGARSYALSVTADDGFGGIDSVGVTIGISDVNEAPVAVGDAPTLNEDEFIEIDVLANDSDPEGDALTLLGALPAAPRWGTATVDTTTGEITYRPRANYHGSDNFTYRVRDDAGLPSNIATVNITVDAVNDAPTFAPDDTLTRIVSEGARVGGSVGAPFTATDVDENDRLTYSLFGTDASSFEIDSTGQITVGMGTMFDITGRDTYEVTVEADDNSGEANATTTIDVTITVTARPVAPPPIVGGGGGGGFGGGGGGGGGGGPSGPVPSDLDFEWTVSRDVEEFDSAHDTPSGLWSDGSTLFIAQNGDGADDGVYAYDLESGERVEAREFGLADTNRAPRGLWSDGETAWVSDSGRDRLFAYNATSGTRLEDRELELAERNRDARGIWSGGETMWVLDGGKNALFAYDLASAALLGEYGLDTANGDPRGIWSDGVTVWVSDHVAKRLLAYRLPAAPDAPAAEDAEPVALERVRDEEFDKLSRASNNSPRGIWSDGEVMYVADASDGKVYSYNMPDAIDARLASLTLSGVEIGEFGPGTVDYEGAAGEGVTQTTVEAEAAQSGATVVIDSPDADPDTEGHQVALSGTAEIAVTVTSEDGSRERAYRVRLGETAPESVPGPRPHCLRGDIAVGFSLVVYEGGSVGDLVACAQSRGVTALYALSGGEYVSYTIGAPEFVNAGFGALFADGVPALTPLTVRSESPVEAAAAAPAVTEPFAVCLRGEVAVGFSLLVYEGGSVGDLEACAERLGVGAIYVLAGGEWVSYILGAPGFVNAAFRELFLGGVPPVTPLIVRRDGS